MAKYPLSTAVRRLEQLEAETGPLRETIAELQEQVAAAERRATDHMNKGTEYLQEIKGLRGRIALTEKDLLNTIDEAALIRALKARG